MNATFLEYSLPKWLFLERHKIIVLKFAIVMIGVWFSLLSFIEQDIYLEFSFLEQRCTQLNKLQLLLHQIRDLLFIHHHSIGKLDDQKLKNGISGSKSFTCKMRLPQIKDCLRNKSNLKETSTCVRFNQFKKELGIR